ncbi:helix-turn-helix domain-containing protein [Halomonas sp. CS7]|uniref:Helix-turn-helix domain-containing protein n=1 Tax=Halomonas pelophila TaxID=3151122 RepID=A0ABV1N535_9GAMM
MLKYGQFCPVAKAAEILGEKWTLLILRELLLGATRFSQLQKGLSKISPTVLNKRLHTLQEAGLIIRRCVPDQRSQEYQLTEAGRELYPIIIQIAEWGMRWARGQMTDDELDVQLLMNNVQSRIDPEKLPGGRTIIHFHYTDLQRYNHWWIKVNGQDVDLCIDNPCVDVDVNITTDLRTMTEVWLGDLSINNARDSGKLKVVAPSAYTRNIRSWLGLYFLADVRPQQPN